MAAATQLQVGGKSLHVDGTFEEVKRKLEESPSHLVEFTSDSKRVLVNRDRLDWIMR